MRTVGFFRHYIDIVTSFILRAKPSLGGVGELRMRFMSVLERSVDCDGVNGSIARQGPLLHIV